MPFDPLLNGTPISIRSYGTFLEDEIFHAVRQTLNKPNGGLGWPPLNNDMIAQKDFLSIQTQVDSVFFLNDRIELVIDARGFSPDNLRCNVTQDIVEVIANKDEKSSSGNAVAERSQNMSRRYQLPQKINPQQSSCCLSSDGVLVITALWAK